jgi:hypothetical protein
MKSSVGYKLLLISALLFFYSCQQKNVSDKTQKTSTNPPPKTDINDFAGQWTIDIKGGSVGWLEVSQKDNYVDANLLWEGGSVLPVPYIFMAGNTLYVGHETINVDRNRKYDGDESLSMMYPDWLEIRKDGDKITGYELRPNTNGIGVDSVSFIGTKLPPVPPAPDLAKVKYGKPIVLFNGKDLTGWKLINENGKSPFHVKDGVLVKDPVQVKGQPRVNYSDIRTDQVFKDFNLKIDVKIPKAHNSGIYLRGIYEVQVEQGHADSGGKNLDSHNLGGIYSRISPTVNAEKPANTWQTFNITLCDRHVTIILNGTKIIDNQPLDGPTGGAISPDVFAPGPLMLQGGEEGDVEFRNIVLTPIVN